MRIAFQGEIGAYSEEAVLALFPDAEPVPCASFDEVFLAVTTRDVAHGVIPIENSLFGSVHQNYDLLREYAVHINGEVHLRIRHNLLVREPGDLSGVKVIYSHPQALGQCRTFLRKETPQARLVPAYDTAGAARMIAESEEMGAAAVASSRAAREYGLHILAASIESNHSNYTRFLQISDGPVPSNMAPGESGPLKTSIVYAQHENMPGSLFKSLAVFALRDIDLLKIESRPLVGSPGKYLFYLDLGGAQNEERVRNALHHLNEVAASVKILGSYREGQRVE